MRNLNKVMAIGRLGKDPEVRSTANFEITSFSIACQNDYQDKNGNKVEQTEWIRCVAFGKTAEILGKYLKKGQKVYIEGKFTTRKWEDKNGSTQYSTEVRVENFEFLTKPEGSPQHSDRNEKPAPKQHNNELPLEDDDIPF